MTSDRVFVCRCHLHGLPQPTFSRLRIVRQVFGMPRTFKADDVVQSFSDGPDGLSRATVFRTLSMLVRVGMLSQDGESFAHTYEGGIENGGD